MDPGISILDILNEEPEGDEPVEIDPTYIAGVVAWRMRFDECMHELLHWRPPPRIPSLFILCLRVLPTAELEYFRTELV